MIREAPRIGLHPNTDKGTFITDTETHIYQYQTVLVVEVVMLPGLRWWTLPKSEVLLRQIDGDLNGTGYERFGRRVESGNAPMNKWIFRYPIRPVES